MEERSAVTVAPRTCPQPWPLELVSTKENREGERPSPRTMSAPKNNPCKMTAPQWPLHVGPVALLRRETPARYSLGTIRRVVRLWYINMHGGRIRFTVE